MEFKFRAGEDRPSHSYLPPSTTDGYFTAQALRAGCIEGDLPRSDPTQKPMILSKEAVRRELEKERIRQEIIAEEHLRRKELEEEVCREMAFERELALRRRADRFSLAGGNVRIAATSSSSSQEPQRLLLPPPQSTWSSAHGESLPLSIAPQFVNLGNSTASSPYFSASTSCKDVELISPAKKVEKKEWSCALCRVSATCEQNLNEHIQSRRHKAKEEELIESNKRRGSNKNGAASSPTPVAKESKNSNKLAKKQGITTNEKKQKGNAFAGKQPHLRCEHCEVDCNSESMLASHLGGKKHLARIQELECGRALVTKGNEESKADLKVVREAKVESNSESIASKQPHLRCERCEVDCNSESMLMSHLSGKKHLARMQELECGKTPVNKGNEESKAEVKVVREAKVKQRRENKGKEEEVVSSEKTRTALSIDGAVAKTTEELAREGVLNANEPGGNHKGRNPKNADEHVCVAHFTRTRRGNIKVQLPGSFLFHNVVRTVSRSKKHLLWLNLPRKSPSFGEYRKGGASNLPDKSKLVKKEVMTSKKGQQKLQTGQPKGQQKPQVGQSAHPKPQIGLSNGQQKPQNGQSKGQQKPQVGQSDQQKPQIGQSEQQQVPKKKNRAVKKHPFHCALCKVKCNSELVLESHLRGKMHLARVQELLGVARQSQ